MDYKLNLTIGQIVTATRTYNGEVITGEFRGFRLYNNLNPDSVVGLVSVAGDRVYDVSVNSINYAESEDERIRKAIIYNLSNLNTIYNATKEECLDWLKKHKECFTKDNKISESEDEKIREKIRKCVLYDCSLSKQETDEMIAYLEKQKYDRMKPIYDARESFESALEKAWNDYHNGYENVDKLEDDYVECAYAKGFREGYLFGIEKEIEL